MTHWTCALGDAVARGSYDASAGCELNQVVAVVERQISASGSDDQQVWEGTEGEPFGLEDICSSTRVTSVGGSPTEADVQQDEGNERRVLPRGRMPGVLGARRPGYGTVHPTVLRRYTQCPMMV